MSNFSEHSLAYGDANFSQQWLALYDRAIEHSVVQHPAWLKPMLTELGGHATLTWGSHEQPGQDELSSVAALQKRGLMQGFALPMAVTWDCGFLFSGLPLLDSSSPDQSLARLVAAAGRKHSVHAVLFRKVSLDGAFYAAAKKLAASGTHRIRLFDEHDRAALHCHERFDSWFNTNFSAKRRREFRRLRKRLSELGTVEVEAWQPGKSLRLWTDDFLQLEAAGWKGVRGTAIACSAGQVSFLGKALEELAQSGLLLFWRISLNGRPIAMLFAMKEGKRAILGKMGYDEELARYSPGVMVILAATEQLLDGGEVEFVDSSADPNHPMIDNIWRDRVRTGDVLISTDGVGRRVFGLMVMAEQLRRTLRNQAKRLYHFINRRKWEA